MSDDERPGPTPPPQPDIYYDERATPYPTQPLSFDQPVAPPPPPPAPPFSAARADDEASWFFEDRRPPQPTVVLPPQPRPAPRSRSWAWPVVALLALLLGVVGGIGGGALYTRAHDDTPTSSVPIGGSALGLGGLDTSTAPPIKAAKGSVAAVAAKVLPSTVQISAEYQGVKGGATGSGIVLDRQGHFVTNNHVVASAASDDGPIEIVDEDGNRYDATIVGRSPVYDLAVLYAPTATGLTPAALGSSDTLQVGEGVVAIGSPLGLSSTVTFGIVSALRRPVTTGSPGDDSSYINAVQTDAAINPGNSGGPLVNMSGQVIGINSAIATTGGSTTGSGESGNIGVGFAIPVEQVKTTVDEILRTGKASYPVIGARVDTAGIDNGAGATISSVLADTPAQRAGLEDGDVVTAVDGVKVGDGIALIVSIRSHQPGQTVEFTYTRDGQTRTADVTLGSETG